MGRSTRSIEGHFTASQILDGDGGDGRRFEFQLGICRRPAQTAAAPAENAAPTADNAVMLTIFLKHDQSRP